MAVSVKHAKTNAIADWTQPQLDAIIAGGAAPLPPAGTTLAQVTLPSDWNDDHVIVGLDDEYARLDGTNQPFTGAISATNLSGTNTGDQDLSGYVPYTGAVTDVDLGAYNLKMPTGEIRDYIDAPSLSINNRIASDAAAVQSIDWNSRQLYDNDGVTLVAQWGGYSGTFRAPSIATDIITNAGSGHGINVLNKILFESTGNPSVDWESKLLIDSGGATPSLNWLTRNLVDSSFTSSIDWETRLAFDASGFISINYNSRLLNSNSGSGMFSFLNPNGCLLFGVVGSGFANNTFTPSARVHAHNTAGVAVYNKMTNSTTGALSTDGFDVGISSTGIAEIRQRENLNLEIYTNNTLRKTISAAGGETLADGYNITVNATTGTKIGTTTTGKLGFWNAAPIAQPTTAVAAATFVVGAGTAVNSASTFDGYTIGQIAKALRNAGLLA